MSSGAIAQAFEEMPLIGRLIKKPEAKEGVPLPPPQYRAEAEELLALPEIKEAPPEPAAMPTEEDIIATAFQVTHRNQEAIYTAQQDMAAYLQTMMQELMDLKAQVQNVRAAALDCKQIMIDMKGKKK